MRITYLLAFINIISSIGLFGQDNKYIPTGTGFVHVSHLHYSLGYSDKHEQPLWVAYELEKAELVKLVERTDNFRPDESIKSRSSQLSDYKGSGYDRGHLAPAGDMAFSQIAMSQSFYMSNMSPQNPSFNRGLWRKIESYARNCASQFGAVYIVTGPVIKSNDDITNSIGSNHVSVPKQYYKIIYSEFDEEALGFLCWNMSGTSNNIWSYAVSVDEIENVTGLDFFSQLLDDEESMIESSYDDGFWSVVSVSGTNSQNSTKSQSIEKTSTSKQCSGIASSTGVQCKNKTLNSNGYCHHHQSQASGTQIKSNSSGSSTQCSATTKAGTRCKRSPASGSSKCWQH